MDVEKTIEFILNEGPRSKIKEVVIEGVKAFKPKKLLKLMTNRRKKVYVAKELDTALKLGETAESGGLFSKMKSIFRR